MIHLYHGSTVNIEQIDLRKSRPNKDFGRGFYLSADREQAWRMGEFKALTEGGTRVGVQIGKYEAGDITLDQFLNNLKYMKGVTFQYFFGTKRAISKLQKV